MAIFFFFFFFFCFAIVTKAMAMKQTVILKLHYVLSQIGVNIRKKACLY